MVYSTRRFVLCLTLCHFVLVFFSPFSIAITSLGEDRANLSAFHTFVRFVLVWICRFPLPLGVWEGLDCGTPWTFLLSFYYPGCPGFCSAGTTHLLLFPLAHVIVSAAAMSSTAWLQRNMLASKAPS